jgi:hypothetical protein
MINHEVVVNKIEKLEGKLKQLYVLITRPQTTVDEYKTTIKNAEEILEEVKAMVQRNK